MHGFDVLDQVGLSRPAFETFVAIVAIERGRLDMFDLDVVGQGSGRSKGLVANLAHGLAVHHDHQFSDGFFIIFEGFFCIQSMQSAIYEFVLVLLLSIYHPLSRTNKKNSNVPSISNLRAPRSYLFDVSHYH